MNAKTNISEYSLENKSVFKGDSRYTSYSSKTALNKVPSGDRRAPEYTLERMATTATKNSSKRK